MFCQIRQFLSYFLSVVLVSSFLRTSKSWYVSVMPKSKSDQPITLDRAHLGSRLHRSRGQSSVLESWRSLGSPQLPGPSFPAYESPPTANRQVHWWGFTTLQDGSRQILTPPPPVRLGDTQLWIDKPRNVQFLLKGIKMSVEKKRERPKESKREIVKLAYLAEHRISVFYRGELDSECFSTRF